MVKFCCINPVLLFILLPIQFIGIFYPVEGIAFMPAIVYMPTEIISNVCYTLLRDASWCAPFLFFYCHLVYTLLQYGGEDSSGSGEALVIYNH